MDAFLRDAQEILVTALAAEADAAEWAVVVDRQGGIRVLDPAGWNISALAAEFGARSVFCVRRRAASVRVEGWSGIRACLLEHETTPPRQVQHSPSRLPRPSAARLFAGHATP